MELRILGEFPARVAMETVDHIVAQRLESDVAVVRHAQNDGDVEKPEEVLVARDGPERWLGILVGKGLEVDRELLFAPGASPR